MTIIKDALMGAAIIIVITLLEFIVTLPFDWSPLPESMADPAWKAMINKQLLLTVIPAGLTTFCFAWLLKTRIRRDAVRRAVVWGGMGLFNYIFIGFVNGNMNLIFGSLGIYLLLLAMWAGPLAAYSLYQRTHPEAFR